MLHTKQASDLLQDFRSIDTMLAMLKIYSNIQKTD